MTIQGGYRKYQEVSFLRGVAITTVVLMHLIQVYWNGGNIPVWLRTASSIGGTGGHVFIFCSGFGLYLSYLHHPLRFGEFIRKRFLKIYLPYALFILIHYFLPHVMDERTRLHVLASHLLLYKMFFEKYMCSFGLQLWFVSTIIQLYILFLPLCMLRKKMPGRGFVILGLAVSLVWWVAMYATGLEEKRIWGSFCLQYLWEFMLGMAAADWMTNRECVRIPIWTLAMTAICGLGLQALMAVRGGVTAALNDVPGLLGYGAGVLLLYCMGKYVLRPVFLWIDTLSFEWYLTHVDAIMWAYIFARPHTKSEPLRALAATVFSLATAWIFAMMVRGLMKLLGMERGLKKI